MFVAYRSKKKRMNNRGYGKEEGETNRRTGENGRWRSKVERKYRER
jgi:hypothetical protein